MEGILVFTHDDVLKHKLKDGKKKDFKYCYWEISKFPKQFDKEIMKTANYVIDETAYKSESLFDVKYFDLRLYLAIKGQVKGYFHLFEIEKNHSDCYKHKLRFYSEDWVDIKNGDQLKPSQGWRYYKHE